MGSEFSERQAPGDVVLPCRAGSKETKFKGWDKDCILKIFCPADKDKIDLLSKTKLTVADEIVFDDQEYDGTKWVPKPFQAGGTSNSAQKKIGVLSGDSCEEVAETFYHELHHQTQSGMTWAQSEYDAYYKTEEWTIKKGLPGRPRLRTKDSAGKVVPDRTAIKNMVDRDYPVGVEEIISSGPDKGKVKLSDGTIRPPQTGDSVPGPMRTKNLREIDTSGWKCP